MKRIAILLLAGLLVGGAASAQAGKAAPAGDQNRAPVSATVEGKLVFLNGYICITTPNKTWIVHMPGYIYGFIDGLKEGAQVKLEGLEKAIPVPLATSQLFVTKLTFNGKEYDLSRAEHFGRMQNGHNFRGGPGMMLRQDFNERPLMPAER